MDKVPEAIVKALWSSPWFLGILAAMIAMSILGAIFRSALFRGWWGEKKVEASLWLLLDKKLFNVFHNVTLLLDDGTTQIDHIVVARTGIFVVETKNMSGAIYGTERDATWIQKIGGQTNRFQNPLRQNYRHTKAVAALLGVPHDQVRSIVAFVGNARLKKAMPANVTDATGCTRLIRSSHTEVFSAEQVAGFCAALASGRLEPGWKTHQAHLESLKQRHEKMAGGGESTP